MDDQKQDRQEPKAEDKRPQARAQEQPSRLAAPNSDLEKRIDRLETVLFKLINRIEATGGRLFTTKEKEAYRI